MSKHKETRPLPAAAKRAIRKWEKSRSVCLLNDQDQTKAEAALACLFWKGCHPVTVLHLLANFCGVGLSVAEEKREAKQVLKQTKRLSVRLKQDAEEVRRVDQHYLQLGLDFPDEMDRLSEFLIGLHAECVKSTVLSRGRGLQTELIDTVRFIETITGRPHYAELADLVSAISGSLTDAEDLRKKVQNFQGNPFHSPRSPRAIHRMVERSRSKLDALRRKRAHVNN